ncbi:glycosyltransferase family 4 protein [Pontibacter harenae]|uniref:glycosyltransferase family 4 protein n=1 Tax=Pontibacter harenae TaxID=2894083 RepID=UPI001E4431D1|nr:glycosyltransferase family 4 protein [Pontibacter harenae]MCC9166588.1 glycosyltransferase family 4 protein [Pontibacter harenae]
MKVAYFIDHMVRTSETFIYDLVAGIEKKAGPNSFINVVLKKSNNKISKNTIFLNHNTDSIGFMLVQELENVLRIKKSATFKYNERQVYKKLNILNKVDMPDVAYIDFGQPAIYVQRFLWENKIPFVVHFHGVDASSAFSSSTYTREIENVFNRAAFIITPSFHLKRLLILKGCHSEKIRVIRYGIDVENIIPESWSEKKKADPSVIFLGRLTNKKNPLALLHAFAIVKEQIPNAKLNIIGEGPLKQEVEKRIVKLGLSSAVNLLGELDQKQAHKILRSHWVYAQHSVIAINGDQEGYPNSPAEASAFELPVVATIHNGFPEYIIEGRTGYLVQEFDYESMGNRIVTLLKNPDLAERMGKEGRKSISELNNPHKRINSVYELLQRACLKKKHS